MAEEDFAFRYGNHGDIFFEYKNEVNIGYHYNYGLHAMLFLSYLQIYEENLFQKKEFEEILQVEDRELHYETQELLEKVLPIARKLPLPEEEFNKEITIGMLSEFSSSAGKVKYRFSLEDNLLSLTMEIEGDKYRLFDLSAKDHIDISKAHLEFILHEEQIGIDRDILEFVNRMRDY